MCDVTVRTRQGATPPHPGVLAGARLLHGVPHGGHAAQTLRRDDRPQEDYSSLMTRCFSSVLTTKTASRRAGPVVLAFLLTPCRSPGSSAKLSPARYTCSGPSLTLLRTAPSSTV